MTTTRPAIPASPAAPDVAAPDVAASDVAAPEVTARLQTHLRQLLGAWPPSSPVHVVGPASRLQPGWDGQLRTFLGVVDADGDVVLSVPPEILERTSALAERGLSFVLKELPRLLDLPGAGIWTATFRWCEQPVRAPALGAWEPVTAPGVPQWLLPFGGELLLARDRDGSVVCGVGLKRHDAIGWEIAVGTDEAARGRGLARALVAQAAAAVIARGGVPTYQHDPANLASAAVAAASGFPDRGWKSMGLWG